MEKITVLLVIRLFNKNNGKNHGTLNDPGYSLISYLNNLLKRKQNNGKNHGTLNDPGLFTY